MTSTKTSKPAGDEGQPDQRQNDHPPYTVKPKLLAQHRGRLPSCAAAKPLEARRHRADIQWPEIEHRHPRTISPTPAGEPALIGADRKCPPAPIAMALRRGHRPPSRHRLPGSFPERRIRWPRGRPVASTPARPCSVATNAHVDAAADMTSTRHCARQGGRSWRQPRASDRLEL